MASVSPSSSVSRVAGGDRVGLEIPQAPSSILGVEFALADSGAKLRVVEAYYLALAKYYEVRAVERCDEVDVGSAVESSVVSGVVSAVSSTRSRRRRRRRSVESRLRREAGASSEFESVSELSYLALVAPASRYDARAELGRSPKLSQLLASPREWFLRGQELGAIKCRVGVRAVVFGVDGVRDAVDILAHVSANFRTVRGSFGAELHPKLEPGVLVNSEFVVDDVGADSDEVMALQSVPGYCYLQLIKPECVVGVSEYGRSMDVGRLLSVPASAFRAGVFDCRVAVTRVGLLHVDPGGAYSLGQVLKEALFNSSVDFDRTSLAFQLRHYRCDAAGLGVRSEWRIGAAVGSFSGDRPRLDVQALRESLASIASLDVCDLNQLDLLAVVGSGLGFAAQHRLSWLKTMGNGILESALAMRVLVRMDEFSLSEQGHYVSSVNGCCVRALRELDQGQLLVSSTVTHADAYKLLIALVFRAGSFDAVFRFMDVTRFEVEC